MSDLPPPPSDQQPPGAPPHGAPGQPGGPPLHGAPPPYGAPPPSDAPPGYGQPPPYGGGPGGPGAPGAPGYGPGPYPGPYGQPVGVVPQTLGEVWYNAGLNILLYIITCGIWGAFWAYRTHEDLKRYNGDGLGGVFGLIMGLLVSVVVMFTVPMEIERMYQRDGRQSPVSTIWGLWFLLPLVGPFIWYFKVQDALNEFWLSKGAYPAG